MVGISRNCRARPIRLRVAVLALLALAAVPLTGTSRSTPADAAVQPPGGAVSLIPGQSATAVTADDPVAKQEYYLLEEHTRWQEQQWDPSLGAYTGNNGVLAFAGVLGNAVLLTYGTGQYDPSVTGVSEDILRAHTVDSIRYWAAANRLAGGTQWGKTMFFDSTFELYFDAAAKLMWPWLDAGTQANVDQIITGQAAYTASLGSGNDPLSGSWSPNGFQGNWQADTKVDEMAVYSQSLAPGVAWAPDNPAASSWRQLLDRWTLNQTGLPPADQANPTVVDGWPISANTAHNIYDTFIVENHGSFEPHYLEETWRTGARDSIQFLLAGQPLPPIFTQQPSTAQLWQTILQVTSAQGEPFMPMDNDRYHLYGRDVLPLAFLSQVERDRDAARAEADLVSALQPYLEYPPQYQLTKFSGQASYEPEARAELGISYLLHLWRDGTTGPVTPVSQQQLFTDASGATDYGAGPGLLAQQSPSAFAATVTKPGFVKFIYAPGHDDWLFNVSGSAPSFLPSTAGQVESRDAVAYRGPPAGQDSGAQGQPVASPSGFDGTATLLHLNTGYAGYTTLPTGAAVYATSGTGAGEGSFQLFNMNMPGMPGLDGARTFTGSGGAVTLSASAGGTGGTDTEQFPATQARYVRMQGVHPATQYGYSLWSFSVFGPNSTDDLALGQPTTASSYDDGTNPAHPSGGYPPQAATDGNPSTRWAVSVPERSNPSSWIQVDLGSVQTVSKVVLDWEAAYATAYQIQVSTDGTTWKTVASVPPAHTFDGNWLNVDGEAGFVVHHSTNPIDVTSSTVTLSDGPASGSAGMVVDAYPAQSPVQTQAAATAAAPSGGPAWLRASSADGYLSLFDLSSNPVDQASLHVPQPGPGLALYQGTQATAGQATNVEVSMDPATARVEAPRFKLTGQQGQAAPSGLVVTVANSRQVSIQNPVAGSPAQLILTSLTTGGTQPVTVPAGETKTVTFKGPLLPSPDLALDRTTFPDSPIPPTMTNPRAAVDGNLATSWAPGPNGRMVIDLGATRTISSVGLHWGPGKVMPVTLAISRDGTNYQSLGTVTDQSQGPSEHAALTTTGRYLAVTVPDWDSQDARLAEVSVSGPPPG